MGNTLKERFFSSKQWAGIALLLALMFFLQAYATSVFAAQISDKQSSNKQSSNKQSPGKQGSNDSKKTIRINGLFDPKTIANIDNYLWGLVKKETKGLIGEEYNLVYSKNILKSKDGFENIINKDSHADIYITLGLMGSQNVAHMEQLNKPTIASIVVDPVIQEYPGKNGVSDKKNFTYLTSFQTFESDILFFSDLVAIQKMVVIIDKQIADADFIDRFHKRVSGRINFSIDVVPYCGDVEKTLERIPPDIDSVYLTPLTINKESKKKLIEGINSRRALSFSMLGKDDVANGVLFGTSSDADMHRLARRIALNIQSIVLGDKPEDLPVRFHRIPKLAINMNTADKIGYSPSWDVLIEADYIEEINKNKFPFLNFKDAISEALRTNYDIQSSKKDIQLAEKNVDKARSNLLPSVEFGWSKTNIDDEHASPFQFQHEDRGFLSVSQVLYSELAWSGYAVNKFLQKAQQREAESIKKNIKLELSKAYFNVLRAEAMLNIALKNLKTTKTNLHLARLREAIGYSGKSEVYRWQSELAKNRKDLNEIKAKYSQSQILLNSILSRPLEDKYNLENISIGSPLFLLDNGDFKKYVENPCVFKIFRDFAVKKAVENSPEIKQVEASISALERTVDAVKKDRYIPQIALKGTVSELLSKSGVGGEMMVGKDDTSWNVGVSASWELYSGGEKSANISAAELELQKMRIKLSQGRQQIESRVRFSLQALSGSYPAIRYSKDAAEAAKKNFELIQDAYAKGMVSIAELVDAQSNNYIANQTVVAAEFQFIIDYLEFQRSLGIFFFEFDAKQRDNWFKNLNAYFDGDCIYGFKRK